MAFYPTGPDTFRALRSGIAATLKPDRTPGVRSHHRPLDRASSLRSGFYPRRGAFDRALVRAPVGVSLSLPRGRGLTAERRGWKQGATFRAAGPAAG